MRGILIAVLALLGSAASAQDADHALVMVEQPGCAYCMAWDDQIAPAYPQTAEGRFAPLIRADLHLGPPDGVRYDRRVMFTPTFILLENGQEIARMEGYAGEDFFWPLYSELLRTHAGFVPDSR